MRAFIIPTLVISSLVATGCTNMSKEEQGAVSGAAIGAAAGVGFTALTGGSKWTGAAIGAAAGGIAGHIKGKNESE